MSKDFQKWHALKTVIEEHHQAPLFREQDIWWCSLGANVGVEEDGKHERFERPVLVLRKFNKEMLWGLPLTSQKKEGAYYHCFRFHSIDHTVLVSQLRILSAKRLIRRMGKISDIQFFKIHQTIVDCIQKTDSLRSPRVPNGNL